MTVVITPADFRAWQARMGLSGAAAAAVLGLSEDTIVRYRKTGVPAEKARITGLAMAAALYGLTPYPAG